MRRCPAVSKAGRRLAERGADAAQRKHGLFKAYGARESIVRTCLPVAEGVVAVEKQQRQLNKAMGVLDSNIARVSAMSATIASQLESARINDERITKALELLGNAAAPAKGFSDFDIRTRADSMVKRTMKVNGHDPSTDYVPPSWSKEFPEGVS